MHSAPGPAAAQGADAGAGAEAAERRLRILVAEDDAVARRRLTAELESWGYDVRDVVDGEEAWALLRDWPPDIMILDWMMPHLAGVDLCRRMRKLRDARPVYLILCTIRRGAHDVVEGLEAGADDYMSKPVASSELRARIRVGERTVRLEHELRARIDELRQAASHIKTLQGLIPICMDCGRLRDEQNLWRRWETYLENHADVSFTHGLCDSCLHKREE